MYAVQVSETQMWEEYADARTTSGYITGEVCVLTSYLLSMGGILILMNVRYGRKTWLIWVRELPLPF